MPSAVGIEPTHWLAVEPCVGRGEISHPPWPRGGRLYPLPPHKEAFKKFAIRCCLVFLVFCATALLSRAHLCYNRQISKRFWETLDILVKLVFL